MMRTRSRKRRQRVVWISAAVGAVLLGGVLMAAEPAEPVVPSSASVTWTLSTADTKLTLGVDKDQQLAIYELSSPAVAWNWTARPSRFPLISRVDSGGVQYAPHWVYRDATVDSSDGRKVTIRFANDQPAMELKSVWHARPGRGPVRHTMFITNKAGGPITIYEQESLDLHVVGPKANTSVWYFSDDGSVPDQTGVFCDRLTGGYQKTLAITSRDQDWIPYVVVDSNGACGVYLGWEWSNGRIAMAAGQDAERRLSEGRQSRRFSHGSRSRRDFRGSARVSGRVRRRYRRCREQRAEVSVQLQYAGDAHQGRKLSQGGMERLCRHRQRARQLGSDREEVLSFHRRYCPAGL